MEISPPIIKKGRLVISGASLVVTMPQEWIKENNLKAGDEIMIVSNGDLILKKMTKENVNKIRNQLSNSSQPVATDSQNENAAAESG